MTTFLILGAGSRGTYYADLIRQNGDQVIGVADPRPDWCSRLAEDHGVPQSNVFDDWREASNRPRFADAVVIATPDREHVQPTIAFANLGYHVLLEKPLALTAVECQQLARVIHQTGVVFGVCHILRYARYTKKVKELIQADKIGKVVSVQHIEPVGYWHQAHSFVRGNWRKESESSSMLMAKACHDIDWLLHIVDSPPAKVSSFGSLSHFRREHAPPDATEFCVDCPAEPSCVYSAKKIYQGIYQQGNRSWPLDVLTSEVNENSIDAAIAQGPYGRCVFNCDNDVVDHQIVNIEFQGGQTASMTMTAFTKPHARRTTRIFGTKGEIFCDTQKIEVYKFLSETSETHEIQAIIGNGGHDGAEATMIENFVEAITAADPSKVIAGINQSLASYMTVFAAEQSRREGRVVSVQMENKSPKFVKQNDNRSITNGLTKSTER